MQTPTVLGIIVESMGAPIRGADRCLLARIATCWSMSCAACKNASPPAKNATGSANV